MELLEEHPKVLSQFAAGELDAFETLFRQFQGDVYSWIARIVRDPSTAEDLTLETFWRIYAAHARFDPGRSFGAWARRIATNVAIDHLKTAQSKKARLVGTFLSNQFRIQRPTIPRSNGNFANVPELLSSNCPRACGQ